MQWQRPVEERGARDAWDAVATAYAQQLPDMDAEAPLDRAVLTAFVQMVQQPAHSVVAEVGCGSGRVTAHLADCHLRMAGFDLSPAMVAIARSLRPDLAFAAASAAALPVQSGAFGGLVAWYSLINLPPGRLPDVLVEFARVTQPDAPLIVAFQSGQGERVERTSAYGHPVAMTYFRHRVQDITDAAVAAGFELHASIRREPTLPHETTPQAFVVATRR